MNPERHTFEYKKPPENLVEKDDPMHSIDLKENGEIIGSAEMRYLSKPFPHYVVDELYVDF